MRAGWVPPCPHRGAHPECPAATPLVKAGCVSLLWAPGLVLGATSGPPMAIPTARTVRRSLPPSGCPGRLPRADSPGRREMIYCLLPSTWRSGLGAHPRSRPRAPDAWPLETVGKSESCIPDQALYRQTNNQGPFSKASSYHFASGSPIRYPVSWIPSARQFRGCTVQLRPGIGTARPAIALECEKSTIPSAGIKNNATTPIDRFINKAAGHDDGGGARRATRGGRTRALLPQAPSSIAGTCDAIRPDHLPLAGR